MPETQRANEGGKMVNETNKPQVQSFGKPAPAAIPAETPTMDAEAPAIPPPPVIMKAPPILEGIIATIETQRKALTGLPVRVSNAADELVAALKEWIEESK